MGSQTRDFGNPDSDEFTEAAGLPGVFHVWVTRRFTSDCVL
jgi:hypothetical protein